jgi:hypothetical protein
MTDSFGQYRPTAVTVGQGAMGVTGTGSAVTALSDSTDTTYVTATNDGPNYCYISIFYNPSLPAGSIVKYCIPQVRISDGTSQNPQFYFQSGSNFGPKYYPGQAGVATTYTGVSAPTAPDGSSWTITKLPTVAANIGQVQQLGIKSSSGGWPNYWVNMYEAYLSVIYNQRPVVTTIAPGVQTVSTPTLAWNYSDPENDQQERYWIKIFTTAQATPDTPTQTPVYDSGEVLSVSNTAVVTLPTTGLYFAYIKVADAGSYGRYSLWVAFSSFTAILENPAAPTISAFWDNYNNRHIITIQGIENILQTFNAGGAELGTSDNWTPTNATLTAAAPPVTPPEGTQAFRIACTTPGTVTMFGPGGVSGIPVSPLTQYTFFAKSLATGVGRTFQVSVQWFDSLGASISSNTSAGQIDGSSVWTPVFEAVTAISPANAAFCNVTLIWAAVANAEIHWADQIGGVLGATPVWTRSGLLGNNTYGFLLQGSDDNGVTWQSVRSYLGAIQIPPGSLIQPVPQDSQKVIVYDYEPPPLAQRQFRATAQATV